MIDERFRGAVVALDAKPNTDDLARIADHYSATYFHGAELDAAVSEALPSGLSDESLDHLTSLGRSLYAILTVR